MQDNDAEGTIFALEQQIQYIADDNDDGTLIVGQQRPVSLVCCC